jgi:hypothetical protein
MSDYSDMHLAITDGTFIDWLQKNDLYTEERYTLYMRWKTLCVEYQKLEFGILLLKTSKTD